MKTTDELIAQEQEFQAKLRKSQRVGGYVFWGVHALLVAVVVYCVIEHLWVLVAINALALAVNEYQRRHPNEPRFIAESQNRIGILDRIRLEELRTEQALAKSERPGWPV